MTLLFAVMISLLNVGQPAHAGYIVTLEQVGPNVVATGSGAIDLSGLSLIIRGVTVSMIVPVIGGILTGPTISTDADVYVRAVGPTNFGSGIRNFADSGSGDLVGIAGAAGGVDVPHGYVSDTVLSDRSTYDNATFTSLGVTPGTYVWTWGTGANQNFTLKVGGARVPDAGSTFRLLLVAVSGVFGASRLRSRQLG